MNNKSASSAERIVTMMRYYPKTVLVGAHTRGCLQYTNYQKLVLPNSGIIFQLPCAYKEIPGIKYFENHGYKPDIECSGQDAFVVALNDLKAKSKKRTKIQHER